MLKIIINGACGKMGRIMSDLAAADDQVDVVAGVDLFAVGAVASYPLYETLGQVKEQADVVVDFSRPDALADILSHCQGKQCACVLATTAYTPEQDAMVREAATKMPVFRTANMSLGMNVVTDLVSTAAQMLTGFDVEIVEAHHNTKVDSPSGSALMLADAVKGVCPDKAYVFGRDVQSGRRQLNELGIHSIRGGTITGDHEVLFIGADEIVRVQHTAQSRGIFAQGALRAAKFIMGKPAGLYNMHDILLESAGVTSLITDDSQALVSLELGGATKDVAQLFAYMAANNINVDMISQSYGAGGAVQLGFTLEAQKLPQAKEALQKMGAGPIQVLDQVAKITAEGLGMERQPGIASRVFGVLAQAKITVHLITTSETRIALCIDRGKLPSAKAALAEYFGI